MTLVEETETAKQIETLSNEQLSQLIAKCQKAISEGSAGVKDYEAYVLCQKELARRTWS